MAIKPIQFSEMMVRALLAGRKTQTRRVIDLSGASAPVMDFVKVATHAKTGAGVWEMRDKYGASVTLPKGRHFVDYHFCARIAVGDILYVREGWHVTKNRDDHSPANSHKGRPVLERRKNTIFFPAGGSIANGPNGPEWQESDWPKWEDPFPDWVGKFRQAMHMPRWASRITLRVTDVRIERLKDISEEDAIAEGLIPYSFGVTHDVDAWHWLEGVDIGKTYITAPHAYFALWDSINGSGKSDANPWVIAYSFELIRGNVDDLIADGTIQFGGDDGR